jgi:hypothetical protein
MRIFELVVAGVLGLLGIRSLVHWVRRPFDSTDPRDHLLYAAYVMGRVGFWWSIAGLFAISATLRDPSGTGAYLRGQAFTDLFHDRFWWYPLVIMACLVLQFVTGFFLGRRRPVEEGRPDVGPGGRRI